MKKIYKLLLILTILIISFGCTIKDNSLIASDKKNSDFDTSGNIILTTQYKVYGKDIERITCFIQNNTEKESIYGEPFSIEKLIDGTWYQIPFPENFGWHAIGYIASPQSTTTIYIDLSWFDYSFTNGKYRVIKEIDNKNYYAEFELGESNITASTPNGFVDLNNLDADYNMEKAAKEGAVVITPSGIENSKMVEIFVENVSRNIASQLRIVQSTEEGDPIITDIIYSVNQDTYFTVFVNNSRDNFAGEGKGITETVYSYMITDGTKIYLSNYAKWDNKNTSKNLCIIDNNDKVNWSLMVPLVDEMTAKRLNSSSVIYKVFSIDKTQSLMLTDLDPLEFGYNYNGFGEIRHIENTLGIAVKIIEPLWASNTTILLVCETTTNLKYYEFFDVQSKSVISYTTSVYDYIYEDGEIRIPE